MDPSTQLPGHEGAACKPVVGTLDLNQGLKLPSEELTGRLPEQNAQVQRAYLSNVCTAKAAQRQGVAAALIESVTREARQQGIKYLYVHVAQNNQAAKKLYCTRCGFHEEQKENESYARALGRPPRLLLCQALAA